jgi:hypothetical protein
MIISGRSKKALDTELYNNFFSIAKEINFIKMLAIDSNEIKVQKNIFLAGSIENPNFNYPNLNKDSLKEKLQEITDFRKKLKNESNNQVASLYKSLCQEQEVMIQMLLCAGKSNSEAFSSYSVKLFGEPNTNTYDFLRSKEPKNLEINKGIIELSKHLAEKLDLKVRGNVTSLQIKGLFDSALEKLFLKDWRCIIDNEAHSIWVGNGKNVHVPASLTLGPEKVLPMIVHELSHIIRYENGKRSKLKLLSYGLDENRRGEEGVACLLESSASKKSLPEIRVAYYLSVALAMGLDGKKKDFRKTFEAMKEYYLKDNISREKANSLAWNRCVRIFRGTNCKTPGACITKDLSYLEGALEINSELEKQPGLSKKVLIGKFNPSNKKQVSTLKSLEVI